jgi:MYXO-CTERM domain-containing protein
MHLAGILGLAAAAVVALVAWRRRSSHEGSDVLHVFPSAKGRNK